MWEKTRALIAALWRGKSGTANPEIRLAQGWAHETKGQIVAATDMYARILRDFPAHARASCRLASLKIQQAQYDEAALLLQEVLKHDAYATEALIEMGNLNRQQQHFHEAENYYLEAITKDPSNTIALFNYACCLQDRGQDAEAAEVLKEVLKINPASEEVQVRLGRACLKTGETVLALDLFRELSAQHPNRALSHINLALALKSADRTEEALSQFQLATECSDANAEAWLGLAQALETAKRPNEAINAYQMGLALTASAPAYNKLGMLYLTNKQYEDAEDCFQFATNIDPTLANAFNNLGRLYREQDRMEDAAQSFRTAVEIKPSFVEARINLGMVLQSQLRFTEALRCFELAVECDPTYARAYVKLGFIYREMGEPQKAIAYYDRALELNANDFAALCHKGFALQDIGEFDAAFALYERVLAERPDFSVARWYRSYARLLLHDFDRGWPDYESRRLLDWVEIRDYGFPQWQGEPTVGKLLLVYGEQGLGDQIMFASCYPELFSKPGYFLLECEQRLAKLFQRSFPQATVIGSIPPEDKDKLATLGDIDYQVAAGSLPLRYRRSISQFPRHAGYLQADPARVAYWKAKLDALGPSYKVGISWRGGVFGTRTFLRSIPLADWGKIFNLPNLTFINLQYGETTPDIEAARSLHGVTIQHWPEAIQDLDETAALICALDLVLSVCNTTIHLGGALGRPVWILVPTTPEWRYGQQGETMPWYPSVKLYRQQSPGEWDKVLDQVSMDLTTVLKINR